MANTASQRQLQELVHTGLKKTGLSDRQASLLAQQKPDFIRNIKNGVMPAFDKVYRLLTTLGYTLRITKSDGQLVAFLGIECVWDGAESEIDMARQNLKDDLGEIAFLGTKNLNQSQVNSENPGSAVPSSIALALNLPEDASLDDTLNAIDAYLAIRPDSYLVTLRDEVIALHKARLIADVKSLTDQVVKSDGGADDDQIAEPPALYGTVQYDDLANDAALSAQALPSTRQVATMEFEAAAGGGAYNLDEVPVKGQVWFQRDWLDSKGLDATQCNVISVKGESMEPTLPDGAKILIARHRCRRRVGRIFVVNTPDGLIVKRLDKNDKGHWQLLSEHPDWKAVAWQRDMTVVGEVMWMGVSL